MKKLEKTATSWSLTAHRLTDGAVVYRDAAGGWTESVSGAAVYRDKAQADAAASAAEADVAARRVVAVYLFEVDPEGTGARPSSVREKIRAAGPTVRPDLGKQAANP